MNYQQILALLQAKFAGVRKDGLAQLARMIALQVTSQEEAQALIDKLDVEKVTETVKDYRKDVDKEVSEANKTYEGNLKRSSSLSNWTIRPRQTIQPRRQTRTTCKPL